MFEFKQQFWALLMCVTLLGGMIGSFTAWTTATSTATSDNVVVLDAGHGGIDNGVIGVATGNKESYINLQIARYLQGYLVDGGFKVVMTRKSQAGLYGLPTKGFKRRDMEKRKQIALACHARLLVSIHQNFCPIPSRRGGTAFYDKSSSASCQFAQCVQKQINDLPESTRAFNALVGDYYILKCVPCPSIIVECGFLSNREEDILLGTAEYQKKMAYTIFRGIVFYFSNEVE